MKHLACIFLFFNLLLTGAFAAPHSSIVIPNFPGDTLCPNSMTMFMLSGSTFTDSMRIDWGDGSAIQTYTANPNFRTHTFAVTSIVKVITYQGALTDTARALIKIIIQPTAKFGFTFNSLACVSRSGIQVTFSDSTTGGNNPPYRYDWRFGDGGSDTAKNPVHTYYQAGKYIISLTVKVKNPPIGIDCAANIYKDSLIITADANLITSMNASAGCPCNKVSFSATGTAVAWHWNFGDGDTSVLQNPTHLYREPGNFVVTLNGTGNTGCYFTKAISITVCSSDTIPISKSSNNWYFGGHTGGNNGNNTLDAGGINFNSNSPTALTNGNIEANEGSATISDPNTGNLLFYTNGMKVWDNTHNVMPNGSGLMGGYSTSQTALIVPFPGNRNLYYIFTGQGYTDFDKGYYYSIVDMTLNNGKGDVTTKNILLFNNPCHAEASGANDLVPHEALSGTVKYKGDCTRQAEYWIIIPACKDTFKTFLINSSGINPPVTTVAPSDSYNSTGYSCISPDGNKYAVVETGSFVGTNKIRVFDFNKNTGKLSNEKQIVHKTNSSYDYFYGLAFSPNSSVLYATNAGNFYQWDLNAPNISTSVYHVYNLNTSLWGNYLGSDGKIYVVDRMSQNYLSVIKNPDVLGAGCNLTHQSAFLGARKSQYGLQNIIPLAPLDTVLLHASFIATQDACTYQTTFADSLCRFMPDSVSTTWDYGDGNTVSFNTAKYPSHTYLNPGTYSVKLLLTKNCYRSDSIVKQITINPILNFSITPNSSSCGLPNGSATANPVGGNPLYTYSWSNSTTNQTASGLIPNTYSLTITDGDGCTRSSSVTINNFGGPIVTLSVSSTILCSGGVGSVSATVSGGNSPYTYNWSNGTTSVSASTTNLLASLTANNYSLVVSDVNGCSGSSTIVSLIDPILLTVPTLTITNTTCGQNNGLIQALSNGGTGTLIYNWSNGANGQIINNLSPNSYSVTVTDNNGCSQTAIATVSAIPTPTVSAYSISNLRCRGVPTGIATMTVSGGTAPFIYLWSIGNTTISATGLAAGIYTLSVSDSNNCVTTATVIIDQPLPCTINLNSTPSNCNLSNGSATAVASGGQGSGSLSYTWSNGSTSTTISGLASGTYSLTITDGSGCKQDTTIAIGQNGGPSANAGNSFSIMQGGNASLSGSGGGNYLWSPSTGLNCNSCQNPMASPIKTTTYYLIVTDRNGCTAEDSMIVTVNVIDDCINNIFIPNAFSPNEDGQNDLFKVSSNSCIKSMTFIIYDRWGEKVFSTTNINDGWDGTYKGKDLDTDVYSYMLSANLSNNSHYTKKGNVSLVR